MMRRYGKGSKGKGYMEIVKYEKTEITKCKAYAGGEDL